MRILLMSVATLAMATAGVAMSPLDAQGRGNGQGQGNGQGNDRGQQARGNGQGNGGPAAIRQQARGPERGPPGARGPSDMRGQGQARDQARGVGQRGGPPGQGGRSDIQRGPDRDDIRSIRRDDDGPFDARTRGPGATGTAPGRGLIDGCPPGLARKYNGCQPPGQVRERYRGYEPSFFGLRDRTGSNYFYDDGYLVRFGSGDRISSYIPLLGGALSLGNTFPDFGERRYLPDYQSEFYGLNSRDAYRYQDNVVYRVDPETSAITGIAAMLTGDDIQIGQPLPSSYGVYNVPYAYRDRYRDSATANYRYGDGYIYRVDPETRIVAEIIEMLV